MLSIGYWEQSIKEFESIRDDAVDGQICMSIAEFQSIIDDYKAAVNNERYSRWATAQNARNRKTE